MEGAIEEMSKRRSQGKGDVFRQGCNFKKYAEGYERVFRKKAKAWNRAKVCPACKGLGCNHCEDGMIYDFGVIT